MANNERERRKMAPSDEGAVSLLTEGEKKTDYPSVIRWMPPPLTRTGIYGAYELKIVEW